MDQARRAEFAQDAGGAPRLLCRIVRDPDVQRFAAPHELIERAHGLLERRLRVEAMTVEDVYVVEPQAGQALVCARDQVLARTPLAVGPGPHAVAGLARDQQLV